ncbi:K+ channel tetramerization domain protein [Dictyocaulus viviparus]|uniref:K+ channel tetramerization domain protein n=1 Tax=Dictyocaulus viviparus TaxID=29172 RepID=A0A0D8YE55_DICVI|nr:K+ channel tetramerization domain protein [Dictyocaulus viviparus]
MQQAALVFIVSRLVVNHISLDCSDKHVFQKHVIYRKGYSVYVIMAAISEISEQIVNLNVGGQRFATSSRTLTWIPDSFFTSLLSGRILTVRDESGAIFIDRDPEMCLTMNLFSNISPSTLKHEAQYFGLTPLVRRLTLCEELDFSSCGSVLFHAMISAPNLPFECSQADRMINNELSQPKHQMHAQFQDELDPMRVRIIRAHHNSIIVAYAYYACVYRMKESLGWQSVYCTPPMESLIRHAALNTKFGPQNTDRMVALALANGNILLWALEDDDNTIKIGTFSLSVNVDNLFFIGSQMVALSRTGKVGIWHSMTHNWQVQDIIAISCYDTAGSSLLLGCTNGSIMKDNDLLVTELYKDPNGDGITSISVYLTPKTNVCGNWIEIAYGTSSGAVRVIVQHPETVGHGPQLFQTYTVHNSPVTRVTLSTNHLISVCSEYNHVRSWIVTRFRGMISTQPGSTSLASFKVLTLDSADDSPDRDHADPGPYGDQDGDQVFVQRVVPNTNQLYVRLASTGERICTIRSVDGSAISSFTVHECEGSSRMGSRPRRFLFCGTTSGSVQMWDLTTALDQYTAARQISPATAQSPNSLELVKSSSSNVKLSFAPIQGSNGPSPQELLQLIDECEVCCNSVCPTPSLTPRSSMSHLPSL